MNINNVSFKGVAAVNQTQQPKVSASTQKKDSFEKAPYNSEQFAAELKALTDKKGKPKFDPYHVAFITGLVDQKPEKYEPLKHMASLPKMKGKELVRLAKLDTDKLNILGEFSKKTDAKNKYKYSGSDLLSMSSLSIPELERVRPLTDTVLKASDIVTVSAKEGLDVEKLGKKITDMEKSFDNFDPIDSVSFKDDIYDPENSYSLTGFGKNGTQRSELLDKNLKRQAISETTYSASKNNIYTIVKTNDLRNNTTSKVRYYTDKNGYPIVQNQVRIIKDKNGKVNHTEYMMPSEVKGVYDIKNVYPNGREEQVSKGTIDKKTGIVAVHRDMKSLDGTRTEYLYENDPQGNRIVDYKITDENGKELLKYSQTLEVIDDNKFITSKNDKSYEVTISDDKKTMTVKDLGTKAENVLNLDKMLRGDKQSMINLLKKFPGEELIALKDTTKVLKGMKKMDDCCYWSEKKEIDVVDDLFSVLHELGHAKDFKNGGHDITANKDVQEVFDKERAAFNKAFPEAQRNHINYFIDVEEHYSGFRGGLEETVAESNALLNSYNGELDIAARAQYLQQYFPKTIAKLAQTLHK